MAPPRDPNDPLLEILKLARERRDARIDDEHLGRELRRLRPTTRPGRGWRVGLAILIAVAVVAGFVLTV